MSVEQSRAAHSSKKNNARKVLVLDRPFQLSVVFIALAILSAAAMSFIASIAVIPDGRFLAHASPEELKNLIIHMNAVYYLVSAAAIAVLAIVITHRVAGPAYVLRNAMEAIGSGNYTPRMKLRKRDYLQSLSEGLSELAVKLSEKDARTHERILEIDGFLEKGDVEGARSLVETMKREAVDALASAQTETENEKDSKTSGPTRVESESTAPSP